MKSFFQIKNNFQNLSNEGRFCFFALCFFFLVVIFSFSTQSFKGEVLDKNSDHFSLYLKDKFIYGYKTKELEEYRISLEKYEEYLSKNKDKKIKSKEVNEAPIMPNLIAISIFDALKETDKYIINSSNIKVGHCSQSILKENTYELKCSKKISFLEQTKLTKFKLKYPFSIDNLKNKTFDLKRKQELEIDQLLIFNSPIKLIFIGVFIGFTFSYLIFYFLFFRKQSLKTE